MSIKAKHKDLVWHCLFKFAKLPSLQKNLLRMSSQCPCFKGGDDLFCLL